MYHFTHGKVAGEVAVSGKVDPGAVSRGIGTGTINVANKAFGVCRVSACDTILVSHVCCESNVNTAGPGGKTIGEPSTVDTTSVPSEEFHEKIFEYDVSTVKTDVRNKVDVEV